VNPYITFCYVTFAFLGWSFATFAFGYTIAIQGHTYAFHIPSLWSELPAAWDHFGDVDEMILAALATVETGHACFPKDLPEIHNGLLFQPFYGQTSGKANGKPGQ